MSLVHGVTAQDLPENYIPTPNTDVDATPDPKKQGPKHKKIRYIVKEDTKKTLSGNACFEEVTRAMGFMYLAVPKGQEPYKVGFHRWWHNFGVGFVLVFKNGPFWKVKVNKKRKYCKYSSGDFIG
jgi:hypothetical protein